MKRTVEEEMLNKECFDLLCHLLKGDCKLCLHIVNFIVLTFVLLIYHSATTVGCNTM